MNDADDAPSMPFERGGTSPSGTAPGSAAGSHRHDGLGGCRALASHLTEVSRWDDHRVTELRAVIFVAGPAGN
ncbi:MAG TPA: hypothetical protein VLW50_27580 [Streptosporangiaceae bacterium]|nr:hypothetical protein [Streptosporangiaceae bacterium]